MEFVWSPTTWYKAFLFVMKMPVDIAHSERFLVRYQRRWKWEHVFSTCRVHWPFPGSVNTVHIWWMSALLINKAVLFPFNNWGFHVYASVVVSAFNLTLLITTTAFTSKLEGQYSYVFVRNWFILSKNTPLPFATIKPLHSKKKNETCYSEPCLLFLPI